MTDRELIERAARAAGYDFDGSLKHDRYSSNIWDPLFDDGDAFRLMVALDICVRQFEVQKTSAAYTEKTDLWPEGFDCLESWEDAQDRYSATRRAIVRAAAALTN